MEWPSRESSGVEVIGRAQRAASLITAVGALLVSLPQVAHAGPASTFDATVSAIEALPYQPAYVPAGADAAFPSNPAPVPNTAPAEDYTSGSIPGDPDAPAWPPWFTPHTITEADGTQIQGMVDIQPGHHPAVLVVHGFNTHGYYSVIRWAAMLAANGYDVAVFDQRDYYFEHQAGEDANRMQTFGWKESA